MSREDENIDDLESVNDDENLGHSSYVVTDMNSEDARLHLGGMYQQWFLDYASYVITDRAIPYIEDGFKPVQRRIMHTMKTIHDGRYNKVANIVGQAMQYHPHGDASIYGALVELGQKDLLIDAQGNWGNILTGDDAAAPRYIEARLSKFALDVVFCPQITDWKKSYDGRKNEPITLPVKFPLLLAQGATGIAVTLKTEIMPHNFNEILDAAIAYLKGEEFTLYPDFPTGGMCDVQRYNDGERGGVLRVRSHISKLDNKTLVITDLPYGMKTEELKEKIIAANEKGKISIKNIVDETSSEVKIILHLSDKTSSDKMIDALYALNICEKRISPYCSVIKDKKPIFTNVSELLKFSADHTKELLRKELEYEKGELLEKLHFCSLEKIFIENRIYKDKDFENAKDMDAAVAHVDKRLKPFVADFVREVTREDILRLMEIKMRRILKFSSDEADRIIFEIKDQIAKIDKNLKNLVEYTINWFAMLKEKYGADHPRKTEIRVFDTVAAAKVVEANEKLYVNRDEGFVGFGLKKGEAEYVCPCSEIDDVLVIFKDGKYKIIKVKPKEYVGKNILYVNVFKKNDKRMVYNVVYRNGKLGPTYMKRFSITGVTRDKDYDITQGEAGSKILYFSANKNAEAEVIHVKLKPKLRLKVAAMDRNFADIAIKGRASLGKMLTKNEIFSITMKTRGSSTMGGRNVWFDTDILRINYDSHGTYLGEFMSEDKLLVVTKSGEYYMTGFEDTLHFPENVMFVEKLDPDKVWTVCLYDANEKYAYIKRFMFDVTAKPTSFIGDNPNSRILLITSTVYPHLKVNFGGNDSQRAPMEIDFGVEEFIAVKGVKAKGKRIHPSWVVGDVVELEPTKVPDPEPEPEEEDPETSADDTDDNDDNSNLPTDENGQLTLF